MGDGKAAVLQRAEKLKLERRVDLQPHSEMNFKAT
jgi:hypothetical protein